MKIQVGDLVKVTESGFVYERYDTFMSTYKTKDTKGWYFDRIIPRGTLGVVESINEHPESKEMLAIVNTDEYSFIINVKGLVKTEKFNKGDKARCLVDSYKHVDKGDIITVYHIYKGNNWFECEENKCEAYHSMDFELVKDLNNEKSKINLEIFGIKKEERYFVETDAGKVDITSHIEELLEIFNKML